MPEMPPEPRPAIIDWGDDGFWVDPSLKGGSDPARGDRLVAMTPTERGRWNEAWKQFLRPVIEAGHDPYRWLDELKR